VFLGKKLIKAIQTQFALTLTKKKERHRAMMNHNLKSKFVVDVWSVARSAASN